MLFRRGGEKPEVGQLKELKSSAGALAAIVERQGRRGWHIADGRYGTDDLRDKFRKAPTTTATEQGGTGGAKTVTPAGSLAISVGVTVNNHTLTAAQMPAHTHPQNTYDGQNHNAFVSGGGSSGYYPTVTANSGKANINTDSVGSGGAHNHTASGSGSGSFTGSSHTNEPQHIVVCLLQYTGQKVSGVTV